MVRLKYYLGLGLIGLLLFYLLIFTCRRLLIIKEGNAKVTVKYKAQKDEDLTIYWDDGSHFTQGKHVTHTTDTNEREYVFEIRQPKTIAKLRVDPADTLSAAFIYDVSITETKIPYHINRFDTFQTSGLTVLQTGKGYFLMRKPDNFDPYIIINIPKENQSVFHPYSVTDRLVIFLCFLLTILTVFLLAKYKIWINFLLYTPIPIQILTSLFILLISCYWTNFIFEYYTAPASIENRKLAKQPDFDTIRYAPDYYFKSFTDWFSDNYPFRQKLVHYNSLVKVNLFGVSPIPDELIIGKDFQFFAGNQFVQDDYMGKSLFPEDQLNFMKYCLEEKKNYLKAHNIDFYLVIPPAKQTVYHNLMPELYRIQEGNFKVWEQVKNRMMIDDTNMYVDVIDTLFDYFKHNPGKKVFFQYDIHWSEWGAFKGYQVLMNKIYKNHPEYGKPLSDDEITIDTVFDDEADLAKLIVLNKELKREKYLITPIKKDSIREESVGSKNVPVFIDYNPAAKGRILIYCDSYSEEWRRFIAHHFNECIFIWDHKMNTKTILQYKPDIVIQENSEMYLIYLFDQLIIDKDA